jgi:hypothetical protein
VRTTGAKSAAGRACVPGADPTRPLALDAGGSSVWVSVDRRTWVGGADLNSWSQG